MTTSALFVEAIVEVGMWILDRILARGVTAVRRMLHNSCRRIKRRIARLGRRLADVQGTKRAKRLQRRVTLHRWRLDARRRLLDLFVRQPHAKWSRAAQDLAASEMTARMADVGNTLTGAPYPWEMRKA